MKSFLLFLNINAKAWWRSVGSTEMIAFVIYAVFMLLLFAQLAGIAVLLIFTPDFASVQQIYPWFTEDIHLLFQLLFANMLWVGQFFFTRSSRLQFNENRKLVALGFSLEKVSRFMNIAGLLHPLNLLFNAVWLFFLVPMADGVAEKTVVIFLILLNYGLIHVLKWHFKTPSKNYSQWLHMILVILFFVVIFWGPGLLDQLDGTRLGEYAEVLLTWLIYTPGMLLIFVSSAVSLSVVWMGVAVAFMIAIGFVWIELNRQTRRTLQQPPAFEPSSRQPGRLLKVLIRLFGHEGGKYIHAVSRHTYCRTQILFIYLFVGIYAVLFTGNDAEMMSGSLIMLLASLIPVTFLMLMLSNAFGFENRELLLSFQFPAEQKDLLRNRVVAALIVTAIGSAFIPVLIPFLYDGWLSILQSILGVLLICLTFLYFISWSSVNNYKKIEQVGFLSMSNPVIPISVTFISFIVVMIVGLLSFTVIASLQVYHVIALLVANSYLLWLLRGRLNRAEQILSKSLMPKLWNEL